mmetsp:Transcript_45704/g.138877  ORF Transcript_45704/g.138877 Transcript_45704/m.138877 type:complete len:187 (-) Transcript_45704:178-738(-)
MQAHQMQAHQMQAHQMQAHQMQGHQMQAHQMQGQHIQGQQLQAHQMQGQQMQAQQIQGQPGGAESEFYSNMFENLSSDNPGSVGNAAATAATAASRDSHTQQNQNYSGAHQGVVPTPPPGTMQTPSQATPPAADRVVSQSASNCTYGPGNQHMMDKMLTQTAEEVNMCSFDLSLDLSGQSAVRPHR